MHIRVVLFYLARKKTEKLHGFTRRKYHEAWSTTGISVFYTKFIQLMMSLKIQTGKYVSP